MRNPKILLLIIIAIFLLTRLYQLTAVPPALYWDEASIAVNAHFIAEAGKDEWGKAWPLHFRAFGEFKLPVYIYTVAIFEKLLGLNEWVVRLPAVIFSLGALILTYLLGLKVTGSKATGLLSAFGLITLPWFFILSRVGYEATAGLAFYLLGIWVLLSKKPFLIPVATVSFILSSYSYNSFRVLVPLTLILLLVYYLKVTKIKIPSLAPLLSLSLVIYIVSLLPIVRQLITPNQINRFATVSIFSSGDPLKTVMTLLGNYLSHFSINFLFIDGDKFLRSQQEGFGQLFPFQLPLILLGFLYVFKAKNILGYVALLLLLLAPLPAAITRESPHGLRTISAVPFLVIISAMGLKFLADYFSLKKIPYLIFLFGTCLSFLFYFYRFITVYPTQSAADWQYGYKRLYLDYGKTFANFDQVIVSDYLAQPYVFYLYYLKLEPYYLSNIEYNKVDKWGFSTVARINNLIFTEVMAENLPKGKLLIFASPQEKLTGIIEKGTIKNLDSSIAFYVYEYQNK